MDVKLLRRHALRPHGFPLSANAGSALAGMLARRMRVGLAAGFSIATGLFFGYYMANKASQLDPIEVLRQQ